MKQNKLSAQEFGSGQDLPPLRSEAGSEARELVADKIEDDVTQRLEDGEIELTEAAGLLSLVELLRQFDLDKLDEKQAFKMLQDLTSKKTPNPVQRIEERQQIDIKVVFADLIQSNPDVIQRTLEIAHTRNEEVKQRLQLDSNMMLAPKLVDGQEAQPLTQSPVSLEPVELNDIRKGGDGSRRKIEWATALNRNPA